MANSVNCLICSREVISDDDEEKCGKISQFRQGLQLFCKLLQINGNNVDSAFLVGGRGRGEDDVDSGPLPCCKECWVAFEQMLRLQQAIDLIQASLMEQLDKLKAALYASVSSDYEEDPLKNPPDDILGKFRDQLLSCVRNSTTPSSLTSDHPPRKKRKQTLTKSPKQPSSVLGRKGKEYQSCSVILKRLPVNFMNSIVSPEEENSTDITIKQEISPSFNEPDGDCGRRSSPRKSKLKAFKFIQKCSSSTKLASTVEDEDNFSDLNEEEYAPSPEPPSPIQSNDDEDDYPWESEADPIPEPLPKQIHSSWETCRRTKFSLISPDTLLYQYTLIKVSQGYTHFTCQEPQCPSPHFSDASLNWNSLFDQIADHIKSTHNSLNENITLDRKCPLCPAILPAGSRFRSHLIGTGKTHKGHRIETVVCERCWKPVRNLADAYRCHLWMHKTVQEKEESPEGLPPSLRRSKVNKDKNVAKFENLRKIKKSKVTSKPQKKDEIQSYEKTEFINAKYYAPSPEAPSPFPSNHGDDDQDGEENGYPFRELEMKPTPKTIPNQLNSSCGAGRGRRSKLSKFFSISPDTLLYQYTLIKVSQGYTHFTCQEPQCPSPHFSDLSLNWNILFNQIADHINELHSSQISNSERRKCPLCPTILEAGPKFRAHLVGTHRKRKGISHRWHNKLMEKLKKIKSENPEVEPKLTLKMERLKRIFNSGNKAKETYFEPDCGDHQPNRQIKQGSVKTLKRRAPQISKPVNKIKKQSSLKKSKGRAPQIGKLCSKIKKQSSIKKSKGRAPQIGDHFCQILEENSGESLLLHKSTLLKASYGVSLTCQEPNCDHVINGTDFTAFEEFKHHVKSCHAIENADALWKCPLCPEEFQSGESFQCHLLYKCYTVSKVANNGFPFICTFCWRPVNSVSSLEYHQWLHKSETEKESVLNNEKQPPPKLIARKEKERQSNLKCRYCPKKFTLILNLKAHEATHLPKEQRKRFMCHQCPKLFLSPVAVRAHVEREHERELMKLRTCPFCNKQYNWRNGFAFRIHLKIHRNERSFVCEICGKAFVEEYRLKKHRRTVHEENGEKRWQCEYCEMSYKENSHLKRHRKSAHKDIVGEGEDKEGMEEKRVRLKFTIAEYRPDFIGPKIAFPCPVCEKVFQLKSRMKKHWEKCCKN